MAGKKEKTVFSTVEVLEARVGLFECPERSRKPFSPLWRSCLVKLMKARLCARKDREISFHH